MSTSGNGNPTTKDNQSAVPSTTLQLLITWDQMTGRCDLQGTGLVNSIVTYGMLEAAKDCLRNLMSQQKQSGIVIPAPNLRM